MLRIPRKALISLFAALAAALLVAGCGGGDSSKGTSLEDSNPDNPVFHVAADGSRFGGPVPLTVRFSSSPFHETGPVHWRWRFDDGTISEEQNPVHTFRRPGYYQVLMEARDQKGQDAWNLIVGAWPVDLWETREKGGAPIDPTTIRRLQRSEGRRTSERRKAIAAKSKKRAAQYSSGSTGSEL
jgi:hypothetical protein